MASSMGFLKGVVIQKDMPRRDLQGEKKNHYTRLKLEHGRTLFSRENQGSAPR
jgi:hypothetical protein